MKATTYRSKTFLSVITGLLTLAIFGNVFVFAQSQQDKAISRSYISSGVELVQGALVSTKKSSPDIIEAATIQNADRLVGIVSKTALLELSDTGSNNTQVTLSGSTVALVSDINGLIKSGDKITASPIEGVGMLADKDAQIIGIATGDFKTNSARSKKIKDRDGKEHTVRIGTIPLQMNISYYVAPSSQFVPPFLQNLANSIAGRPVSFIRIMLGCLLLLMAFGSIFVLIYTSVRSGIISLGRNPLAASAIQRGLVGVVIIVVLVAVLTLLAVYLILST